MFFRTDEPERFEWLEKNEQLLSRGLLESQRNSDEIAEDIDLLLQLREAIAESRVPANLPRAAIPGAASVWGGRVFRVVFALLVALALLLIGLVLLLRS